MGKVNVLRVYTDSEYWIQRTLLQNRLVITKKQKPIRKHCMQKQDKNIHADVFAARDHLDVKIA